MNRSALIAAGVIAFDLGVLVVSSHAAPGDPLWKSGKANEVTGPVSISISGTSGGSDLSFNFTKFTTTYTPATCTANGGKPGVQKGVQGCVLPGKGGPAGSSDQGSGGVVTSYKTH
jgi:hypothetical protein